MKKLLPFIFVFAFAVSHAADSNNGKEYKTKQTFQNVKVTGTSGTSIDTDGGITADGKVDIKYNEGTDAADGTIYYAFVTSATVGPTSAASDGITNLLGRYRWYTGNNSNAIINGVEGVCSSYGADESITCRGGMFRSYINPGATIRTSIGADMSARASYSGGTDIGAESGTAFVGARIWMAPYFTAISTPNINNFHGLWIYNEHATVPVTNGIFLSDAGGGFTNDLTLQHGETISNATDGTVAITAPTLTQSGNLTVAGNDFSVGTSTFVITGGKVGIGTTAPLSTLEVAGGGIRTPKTLITQEGGFAIMLRNNSGVSVASGTVVNSTGTTIDNAFNVNPLSGYMPIGVVYGSTATSPGAMGACANLDVCWVVVSGFAYVNVQSDASCVRGEWVGGSTVTAGQGECAAEPNPTAQHDREIGHIVASKDGTGYAWAVIHFR